MPIRKSHVRKIKRGTRVSHVRVRQTRVRRPKRRR
jgi:hypothetical protein